MENNEYEMEWMGVDEPVEPEPESPEAIARKKALAAANAEYAEGYDATSDELKDRA